jgi:branched-chain amino acid transport system substrate-binding protein
MAPTPAFELAFPFTHGSASANQETTMKIRNIVLASVVARRFGAGIGAPCAGQGAVLPRAVVPHRALRAQRHALGQRLCRLLKLVNARGGINGVKISIEECETAYDTARGVECYERLKGKHGGATVFQPLSTGITFALTEKAPATRSR